MEDGVSLVIAARAASLACHVSNKIGALSGILQPHWFCHHYRPLKGGELVFVLTCHWRKLGLQPDDVDFTNHQAIASIVQITGCVSGALHFHVAERQVQQGAHADCEAVFVDQEVG